MLRKIKSKKGFTIIELIVVMAVLAILVAMGVPRYLGYTKDAQVTAMKTDSKIIEQAAYQYALNNSDAWPVTGTAVTPSDDVKNIIAQALVDEGVAADKTAADTLVADLATANAFQEIDESAIQPFIRSTKNPVSEYFIVNSVDGVSGYSNELEGVVFYGTALEDSAGVLHSGLYEYSAQ